MGPCYSPCHWSKVVSCDYPQWFSLALSEGELPQPILHWPCSVVCRTWGSKLRLLQPALTWSHICSLLIPISSSSKGTELGTGSPVLQVLHQSDMEGPSGCQADGPACFCVSPNLWDGDRACLLLCSVCQSKEKRSRGSGLWTPSAPLGPRWEAAHTPQPPGLLGTVVSPCLGGKSCCWPCSCSGSCRVCSASAVGLGGIIWSWRKSHYCLCLYCPHFLCAASGLWAVLLHENCIFSDVGNWEAPAEPAWAVSPNGAI